MTFGRFLVGIIGLPLGIAIVYFKVPIKDFLGKIGWAETYIGRGGTWDAILILGLLTSIFSIMYMFGGLQALLIDRLGPLFGV